MEQAEAVIAEDRPVTRPVFISYASADRQSALAICKAIERRGTVCWISCRDVAPGENYQEAIVRSIRSAEAMVLIFSEAANNSDEIKKELSLASKYRVPIMALRIEDVEPSDAFAYELSTRQWIDALGNWDSSIDSVVTRVRTLPRNAPAPAMENMPARPVGPEHSRRRGFGIAAASAGLLAAAVGTGAWLLERPAPAATAHTMLVRLAGFERLSPDLPATLPAALSDEMIAAFAADGVVGVSTAKAPPAGTAPAYAIGGTLRRDGDKIKFIARMTNERSGLTLWSNTYTFSAADQAHLPRWAAVQASWVARCGLFGISTYPKPLPDQIVGQYLQFCSADSGTKALDITHAIVAAVPDFSWGWSAVEIAGMRATYAAQGAERDKFRQEAIAAADRAISLDPTNSEAYTYKSSLLDQRDLVAQQAVIEKGIAARPLACGCEHHMYGFLLQNTGRTNDAVVEYRRAVDVLPLNGSSQIALAEALVVAGKGMDAKEHFDAAIDLVDYPPLADTITVLSAALTGRYAEAGKALANPKVEVPDALRSAVLKGFSALTSHNPTDTSAAVAALTALPPDEGGRLAITTLGALGANAEALKILEAQAKHSPGPLMLLWFPNLSGLIRDPGFPSVADRMGLMKYWRTTKSKPDVCATKDAPAFCRMI